MNAADQIDEFAEQTAATLAAAGLPRMAARVMMLLTTEESGSATAEALRQCLGASAAAIRSGDGNGRLLSIHERAAAGLLEEWQASRT